MKNGRLLPYFIRFGKFFIIEKIVVWLLITPQILLWKRLAQTRSKQGKEDNQWSCVDSMFLSHTQYTSLRLFFFLFCKHSIFLLKIHSRILFVKLWKYTDIEQHFISFITVSFCIHRNGTFFLMFLRDLLDTEWTFEDFLI